MALYNQRVQTVLTEEQHRRLTLIAAQSGKPLSVLIREAVEMTYFAPQDAAARLEALWELLGLNAPVADWEEMEADIIRGAHG